jgi:hypothetical protein
VCDAIGSFSCCYKHFFQTVQSTCLLLLNLAAFFSAVQSLPKGLRCSNFGSLVFAFLTGSGNVYVWGCGSDGQLGLGCEIDKQLTPTLLPFDDEVVQVACGYYHTMFVTGMVMC